MSVTCHILETHARPQGIAVDLDLDVETDDIRIVAAFARPPLGGEFRLLADIGDGPLDAGNAVAGLHGVMFEIAGVPEEVAREALRLAMHKLPLRCKIVSRAQLEGGDNSEN